MSYPSTPVASPESRPNAAPASPRSWPMPPRRSPPIGPPPRRPAAPWTIYCWHPNCCCGLIGLGNLLEGDGALFHGSIGLPGHLGGCFRVFLRAIAEGIGLLASLEGLGPGLFSPVDLLDDLFFGDGCQGLWVGVDVLSVMRD